MYDALQNQRDAHREAFQLLVTKNARLERNLENVEAERDKQAEQLQAERQRNTEQAETLREVREMHSNYVIETHQRELKERGKQKGKAGKAAQQEPEPTQEEHDDEEDDPKRVRELQLHQMKLTRSLEERNRVNNELRITLRKQDAFLEAVQPHVQAATWSELHEKYEHYVPKHTSKQRDHSEDDLEIPQSSVCSIM